MANKITKHELLDEINELKRQITALKSEVASLRGAPYVQPWIYPSDKTIPAPWQQPYITYTSECAEVLSSVTG